jgi:hypothetical protein
MSIDTEPLIGWTQGVLKPQIGMNMIVICGHRYAITHMLIDSLMNKDLFDLPFEARYRQLGMDLPRLMHGACNKVE